MDGLWKLGKGLRKVPLVFFSPMLWLLYAISGFTKRVEQLEVYGAPGNRFYDNSKYAYLYALQSRDSTERKCYWITGDSTLIRELKMHNLPVLRRWSVRGIWICLRAKHYFFSSYSSDINFWTSRGARLTNYWHGLPIKKIEYDITEGPLKSRYNPTTTEERALNIIKFILTPAPTVKPDCIYCPYVHFEPYFISAFRLSNDRIIRSVYPRVRFLNDRTNALNGREYIGADLYKPAGGWRTVILYAPTFRDSNLSWVTDVLAPILNGLQAALKKSESLLIIKPHPNEETSNLLLTENITLAPANSDIYVLLRNNVDVLISDYSSIVFDVSASNIPVCLFWPDMEDYKRRSRQTYVDLEELFPKKPMRTATELMECIELGLFDARKVNETLQGITAGVKHGKIT